MKKISLFLIQAFIALSLALAVGCSKNDPSVDPEKPPVTNPNTPISDPAGTVTANISTTTNINVQNVGTISWTGPDNFNLSCYGGYSLVSICDLGAMAGLGNITANPQTGYSAPQNSNTTVACETGHGYVIKFEGSYAVTQYVHLYVVEPIINTGGGVMGGKVKYQFTVEEATLTVSKDSLSFTIAQGTQTIALTTNAADWTYSCNAYWINPVKTGNTLSVSVQENTTGSVRSGAIAILVNGLQKNITIDQAMNTLTVSKDSLSFTPAQLTQTITVTTDAADWTYSCNATWISLVKNGNTFSVSVAANTIFARNGVITIQANALQKNIKVTQAAATTTSAPYAIGDGYNENGVMGVVYKISSGGTHGMIVSTTETSCAWSTVYVTTGCSDLSNGMNNMNTIKKIAGWESIYPAFKWCNDLNTGSVTGWYLPAQSELNDLYTNYKTVNATTLVYGGVQISADYYWSSSEYGSNGAWYQGFGSGNRGGYYKYYTYRVRAVRAF